MGVGICLQTNFHAPTQGRSLFKSEQNVGCYILGMELDLCWKELLGTRPRCETPKAGLTLTS